MPGYSGSRPKPGAKAASPAARPQQRIRGVSFKQEYSCSGAKKNKGRAPSMISAPSKAMLPAQQPGDKGRLTAVFDLDETLIYAREGPLYARPGLPELLNFLDDNMEPVVWTAGVKAYAQAVVRNIDKGGVFRHCVYRHEKWFSGCAGYNKDLSLLGRPMDSLLILENTPDCVRGNEKNGIVVSDYEGTPGEARDQTLLAIREMLQDLCEQVAEHGVTVPQYISSTPLLKKLSVDTDMGDRISVYCLDCADFMAKKATRINRDLASSARR